MSLTWCKCPKTVFQLKDQNAHTEAIIFESCWHNVCVVLPWEIEDIRTKCQDLWCLLTLHHKRHFSGLSSSSKLSCQDCSRGHLEGVGQPYAAHMWKTQTWKSVMPGCKTPFIILPPDGEFRVQNTTGFFFHYHPKKLASCINMAHQNHVVQNVY